MYLEKINIQNFRNIKKANIEFSPYTNIIYGNNGEGKTSIVEALGFLGLCKSFKNTQDKNLINFDDKYFYIKGNIKLDNLSDMELETSYDGESKKKKRNSVEILKVKDYIGYLRLVIFSIEDLNLVKGAPQYKRSFLDQTLSQINYQFLEYSINYKKLITIKNALLKNENIDRLYLSTINFELEKNMYYIQTLRKDFIDFINNNINNLYSALSGTEDILHISYKTNINNETKLDNYFEVEKKRQNSLFGTHRDDFVVKLNGKSIEDFGSQGQQRLAIICLKIMQLQYLKEKGKYTPILLLDDVFSEIDKEKMITTLNYISNENYQVIITTTEKLEEFEKNNLNIKLLNIVDIKKENS